MFRVDMSAMEPHLDAVLYTVASLGPHQNVGGQRQCDETQGKGGIFFSHVVGGNTYLGFCLDTDKLNIFEKKSLISSHIMPQNNMSC